MPGETRPLARSGAAEWKRYGRTVATKRRGGAEGSPATGTLGPTSCGPSLAVRDAPADPWLPLADGDPPQAASAPPLRRNGAWVPFRWEGASVLARARLRLVHRKGALMAVAGRRTFILASSFLALTGVLHGVGHLSYRETDPGRLAVEQALRGARVPMGLGMAPSMLELQSARAVDGGVLRVAGRARIVLATGDPEPRALRRLTFVQLAGTATLVLLYAHFHVPPPLVSLALVEVMFVLSLLRQAIGFSR